MVMMMMNFILIMRKLTKNYRNNFTDLNSIGKHDIFYIKFKIILRPFSNCS